jgi:hypothetical protein
LHSWDDRCMPPHPAFIVEMKSCFQLRFFWSLPPT